MADQRNWSDASYKTYCVPLRAQFTYLIGQPRRQDIQIILAGPEHARSQTNDASLLSWQTSEDTVPAMGPVRDHGSSTDADIIRQSGVDHIRTRVDTSHPIPALPSWSSDQALDLEPILADDAVPETALAKVKRLLDLSGWVPDRVIALPAAYLDSHQPCGHWPSAASPQNVAQVALALLPKDHIGFGMLINFTEFNRCPLTGDVGHFYSHSGSAIVHAGDDLSVMETLEALPQIFQSAHQLAGASASDVAMPAPGQT